MDIWTNDHATIASSPVPGDARECSAECSGRVECLCSSNKDVWLEQVSLEKHTDQLLRRIFRLQSRQTQKHVNRQICAFVRHEQAVSGVGCQNGRENQKVAPRNNGQHSNGRYTTIQVPSSFKITATNASTKGSTAEEKIKLFSPEGVKNLSTSALVSLVKKLEHSSGHLNGNGSSLQPPSPSPSLHFPVTDQLLPSDHKLAKFIHSQPCSASYEPVMLDDGALHCSHLNTDEIEQTKQTVGTLKANLHHLETGYDSDATDSSSGGESCNELIADQLCASSGQHFTNASSSSTSNYLNPPSASFAKKHGLSQPIHL